MKPNKITYSLVAADADGLATSQTPLAAGNLTLDGVLASSGIITLAAPQHVSITTVADETARTFTVYGTDYTGATLTETIAGVNNTIANGTKSFQTITRIAVDAATAGAITAGVLGAGEMPWVPLSRNANPFNYAYHVDIGTATFVVESTLDDVQTTGFNSVVTATVQASGSADVGGVSTTPATAVRVKITAFTSGNIVFRLLQAGI